MEGYIYWGVTFSPDKIEKNDYLNFKEDETFFSVNEGKLGNGTWKLNLENKSLYLYDSKSNKPLIFGIIQVTNTELILLLKDEKDCIKLKFLAEK